MNSLMLSVLLLSLTVTDQTDNRPMIGVLMQECWSEICKGDLYIAASYVKYLESAGARVVPVFTGRDRSYYQDIVNCTNGLLIPGGGQYFDTSEYSKAAQMIWNVTYGNLDFNQTYPIWGTCLGFEMLAYLLDANQVFDNCSASNVADNLTFKVELSISRLFKNMDHDLENILRSKKVTYNHHRKCLTPSKLSNAFKDFFQVLTTTTDEHGLEYVSTVEAKNLSIPVFGVQWHPEKNGYEFFLNNSTVNIPHSADAIRVTQYMANFFVNLARERTPNRTRLNLKDESDLLIYNYQPIYSGKDGKSEFTQIYVFNGSKSWNNQWLSSVSLYLFLIVIAINAFQHYY